jgi:NAD(P)-dependent dehydrogenase (short-subunit alcohol dehydrogenase family)
MDILDKRIVVTGAAGGIGKALAKAFKNEGAKFVLIADIDGERATETAAELGFKSFQLNVGNEEEIKSLIDFMNKEEGGIDIFCSNAGIGGVPMLLDVATEDWQNIWDINVMGHIHAAKHVIPQMLERGSGYLVNTASAAGLLTQIGSAPYSVTKAAALSLAEWIKITYGAKGIGVSCLCPQAVETAMTAQGAGTAGVDGMITADECAASVIKAIKIDKFLVTPHEEVLEYIKIKATDYDRWISGMQRLQTKFEDFYDKMLNQPQSEKDNS